MIELAVKDGMVHIPVWVQAGAKKDQIVGEHNGCLKIAVTAPPEGGRANKAVARLLAEKLRTKKSAVEIVSGATSRQKRIAVAGVSLECVRGFCQPFSSSA